MQERHINRKQYFEEQAATSKKYYLKETDYFVKLRSGIRVLEVGCGEGGNLLPYAKAGCLVTGARAAWWADPGINGISALSRSF